MKIYVVYFIDSDWHQTKHIIGVFSGWEIAKGFIVTLGDDEEMGYMVSRQRINEEFTIELGLAKWNEFKFVPLRTFEEGVIPDIKAIHGLE